jgi:amidase
MLDEAALPTIGDWDRRTFLRLTGLGAAGIIAGASASSASRPSSITDMDAVGLSAAIRSRKVSCVEVMSAHLAVIGKLNPTLNAIVALQDADALLLQSAEHDAMLARGERRGPLHGFPHAVKDLQPVKGMRFTSGSPIFRDRIAEADGLMVSRLRRAGVIFIGKTNTPEFGLGSNTFNAVYGKTRNAWNPGRSAGGSSGGAAVALAARMLPLADGSDYGGSLRNPAGWNNVCGFRASAGRVPNSPDEWIPSMGVVGAMGRTVGDLALLMSVIAGHDSTVPLSMESPASQFAGDLGAEMRGKRIGWLGDFGGFAPCEPEVLRMCGKALTHFTEIGCVVEEALPAYSLDEAWATFVQLRAWQQGGGLLTYYQDPARRVQLKPEAVFEVETGLKLSAFDITRLSAARSAWTRAFRALFDRFDYLVAPTAQMLPFDIGIDWPREVAGQPMHSYHEWMKVCCLVTLAGCPSLAVPAGIAPGNLPIGLQIIAPVHQELSCLKMGAAYEAAARWPKRPPLTERL